MSISYLRGHPIFFKDGEWFYVDTDTPTIGNERDCGYCGSENNKEGHDGCLGTLPGVMNACCGHGIPDEAYIQFSSEKCLLGEDAINEINHKAIVGRSEFSLMDCVVSMTLFWLAREERHDQRLRLRHL